jgi:hypothetical protein
MASGESISPRLRRSMRQQFTWVRYASMRSDPKRSVHTRLRMAILSIYSSTGVKNVWIKAVSMVCCITFLLWPECSIDHAHIDR